VKTIHRYSLLAQDKQEVITHAGAQFLSVAVKPGDRNVSLWALVDTSKSQVTRTVCIVGTGNPIDVDYNEPDFGFVGTACIDYGGPVLCWHVFVEMVARLAPRKRPIVEAWHVWHEPGAWTSAHEQPKITSRGPDGWQ
jgi:hypothetical protein